MGPSNDPLEAQKQPWNASAATYADHFDGQVTQSFQPILDAVNAKKGTRLLDVATGPGILAGAAAERGAIASGIDFAKRMIEVARHRYPGLTFETADAADLPFEDGSFEAVTMSLALFMLPEPEKALAEAFRVLTPGGTFAATVWDWLVPGFEVFYKPFAEYMATDERLAGNPPLLGVADREVLNGYIGRAGFAKTAVSSLDIKWRMANADRLFEALASMRDLSSLDDDQLRAFRKDVAEGAEIWREGGELAVPFPMLLLTGYRV